MHCQQPAVQDEKHILAFAIHDANAATLGLKGDARSGLRLRGDRVKDADATDSPTLGEGTERANDRFHFREFRHTGWTGSRTRFERERVLSLFRLGSVAERPKDRLAFVPKRKLIGIMTAARLAGLTGSNQQNGFIPVSGVCHEAHSWAVSLSGRAYAVLRSRLRLISDAEEAFQQSFVAKRMKHVERIKALPRPLLDALTLALIGQTVDAAVRSGHEQLVIVPVGTRQPFCGPAGQNLLEKCHAPPPIEIRVFPKEWLEQETYRCPTRGVQEGDFRRVGMRNSIPILPAFNQFFVASHECSL